MSRAVRLMELADRLRSADTTTVGTLAHDLGVSARTVLRDLATLRERGMPISGEVGPGGGVRLEGSRGVTAVHLGVAEIVTLWLAAQLARAGSELPWSSSASRALTKLLASLPKPRAAQLRALSRRVFVGPMASEAVRTSAGPPPAELLRIFEEAFSAGLGLRFAYRDREGKVTARRVEPHGLLVQSPVWYVLARDLEKGEPRMFRMDRIRAPAKLEGHAFRPDRAVLDALVGDMPGFSPLAT
ncbi:MAG: WYL domain-containing protein [Myxococcales bacterium]|nr:WYL domain-containing protein [Myxococcales bacterium]